jgi:hypothetical protein
VQRKGTRAPVASAAADRQSLNYIYWSYKARWEEIYLLCKHALVAHCRRVHCNPM